MKPTRSISVIVCAHELGRLQTLKQAVHSVHEQTLTAHEIIVVIDHNTALFEACKADLRDVILMENNRSRGLSGARNTGALAASGDVVAFIDDDAIPEPQWLAALSDTYSSQFVMGAGGPTTAVWPDTRPAWLSHEFDWVVGCSYRGQATDPVGMRNMIGCNMSFRRSALVMTGLFAEDLGRIGRNAAGVEETELCLRARNMFPSSHFAYSQSARVDHQIEAYRSSWRYFFRRCIAEGRSKAHMARNTRARGSLNTERHHLFVTLPKAVLSYLGDAFSGRDRHGVARAFNLVSGTMLVVGSYALARAFPRAARTPANAFAPSKVCDVDTARERSALDGRDPDGTPRYANAFYVVRDHGRLRGIEQIPLYGDLLSADDLHALLDPAPVPTAAAPAASFSGSVRVVVATRDRPVMLAKCLDSLLAQDHPAFEIVVVDNTPTSNDTRDLIAERYSGRIRYLREPRPGLANAHNRGIADLSEDVVAFTDDDVIVDRSWLKTITAPFAESLEIGCVTGAIVPAELETRAQYWTELHGGFLKGNRRQTFDLAEHRPSDPLFPYAVGQVGSGANMAFSRASLEAIGGFDPALGAGTKARGGDDLAAFLDILNAGYQVVYMPDALVWHHHRRTESGMRQQAHGYGVGLGAYLTRAIIKDPVALLRFMAVAPRGIAHIFGSRSDKNTRLPGDYPTAFLRAERLGILAGIPSYLQSIWASRRPRQSGVEGAPKSAWSEH
ncbi:glycosyltransferase family 2 protein [Devosia sp.]|uniref:glycosyltransferase family 2 protein n=1 Tax=Devosia sp. TaxID=1871048 RepID=UPI003A93A9ED